MNLLFLRATGLYGICGSPTSSISLQKLSFFLIVIKYNTLFCYSIRFYLKVRIVIIISIDRCGNELRRGSYVVVGFSFFISGLVVNFTLYFAVFRKFSFDITISHFSIFLYFSFVEQFVLFLVKMLNVICNFSISLLSSST